MWVRFLWALIFDSERGIDIDVSIVAWNWNELNHRSHNNLAWCTGLSIFCHIISAFTPSPTPLDSSTRCSMWKLFYCIPRKFCDQLLYWQTVYVPVLPKSKSENWMPFIWIFRMGDSHCGTKLSLYKICKSMKLSFILIILKIFKTSWITRYKNEYIFLEYFSTLFLKLSSSAQDLMWVLIFCGVTLMIFNVIECDNSSAVIGHLVLSPGLLLVHTDHVTRVLASDWLQHTRWCHWDCFQCWVALSDITTLSQPCPLSSKARGSEG